MIELTPIIPIFLGEIDYYTYEVKSKLLSKNRTSIDEALSLILRDRHPIYYLEMIVNDLESENSELTSQPEKLSAYFSRIGPLLTIEELSQYAGRLLKLPLKPFNFLMGLKLIYAKLEVTRFNGNHLSFAIDLENRLLDAVKDNLLPSEIAEQAIAIYGTRLMKEAVHYFVNEDMTEIAASSRLKFAQIFLQTKGPDVNCKQNVDKILDLVHHVVSPETLNKCEGFTKGLVRRVIEIYKGEGASVLNLEGDFENVFHCLLKIYRRRYNPGKGYKPQRLLLEQLDDELSETKQGRAVFKQLKRIAAESNRYAVEIQNLYQHAIRIEPIQDQTRFDEEISRLYATAEKIVTLKPQGYQFSKHERDLIGAGFKPLFRLPDKNSPANQRIYELHVLFSINGLVTTQFTHRSYSHFLKKIQSLRISTMGHKLRFPENLKTDSSDE